MTATSIRARVLVALLSWLVLALPVRALDTRPVGWLGDGTGRHPEADPPLKWGVGTNATWRAVLPSHGNATPVVFGDLVCATSEPTNVTCLRRKDGQRAWTYDVTWLDTVPQGERAAAMKAMAEARAVGERLEDVRLEHGALRKTLRKKDATPEQAARLKQLSDESDALVQRFEATTYLRGPSDIPTVGNASATPATDGRTLVAVFGNALVAGFSIDGKLVWARHLPWDDKSMNGFTVGTSASPLIVNDLVLVALGSLYGLEIATGRTRWIGPAYRDYGTPVVGRVGSDDVVFLPSGEALRAKDGKALGRASAALAYVGPVRDAERLIYVGNVSSDNVLKAAAFAWPARSDPMELRPLWTVPLHHERLYATPLVDDGHLFLVDDRSRLVVLDAANGRKLAERDLGLTTAMLPSPQRAGRHIFFSNAHGNTVVLDAAPPFATVSRFAMGEESKASLTFEGRRVYVRTLTALYCIEGR